MFFLNGCSTPLPMHIWYDSWFNYLWTSSGYQLLLLFGNLYMATPSELGGKLAVIR